MRRHHNLRHVHLRLRHVEAAPVGVVERGDIGVADIDLRRDVFVEQLLHALILADARLQLGQRQPPLLQLLVEFFFRVGRLQFVQTRLHVGIGRHQPGLFRPLQHDLVIDQRPQHLQPPQLDLVFAFPLALAGKLRLVRAVHLGVKHRAPVDRRRDVGPDRIPTTRQKGATAHDYGRRRTPEDLHR